MGKYISSYAFWPAGTALSVTIHSRPISMKLLDDAGLTINTAGVTTNTGTFIIEGTNDQVYDSFGNTLASGPTWFTVPVSPTMVLAGANATFEPDLTDFPWAYLRVTFTPATSTEGTVTGKFYGKSK